ncbi:Membrane protein insertase YidC [Frankliniella fusca]|uniref:Membrane protein insertase YidC n=1 Tax=Frankliniella fusca TaxID=407009 RepID=A0AAE1HLM8_9NEOP|nr:Membrane protein insertase YidC [Frankliniella fusca]
MDTEKNYYVSVKLYSESNINKSYRAHDLYEVSEPTLLYRPFRPKTLDFNPKQKFGVIRGHQFLLLQLLKMAETREGLELGRTIVAKRLSIGNEIIPLKRLKLVEESDAIKETMTSKNNSFLSLRNLSRELAKHLQNDCYENDLKTLKKLSGSNSKHGKKSKKKKRRSKSRDERLNVNDGFDRNNHNENSDSNSKEKSESDDDATWSRNGTKDYDNVSISANGTDLIDNMEERDKENSDQMKQFTVSNTVEMWYRNQ